MNRFAKDIHANPLWGVWRVVLIYAVFASLWFGLFEATASWLITDPARRALTDTVAGLAFVGVTAALLGGLMLRLVRRRQQAFASERAALQSQDRTLRLLQALAENSPAAIFAKDRDGRYLLFNAEAARITGTTAAQVLGRDDSAIFAPEQAAMIRANDERVMAQDRPETFEEELDTADGRVTFLATKGALHDAEGRVAGMFGISHDITERLVAQRRLRDSEQHYRLLFEANPHPMWLVNSETHRFIAVNEAALKHYGYSQDEFLAMTIADIGPPEERARLARTLDHLVEAPVIGPRHLGSWRHRCRDGRLIDAEISTTAVLKDGVPAQLVLAQDITVRRELERQRQAAHKTAVDAGNLLRDVLARVEDGFVALDRDWRYTYLNIQAARMLGREKPADLLGRHIWTEYPEGLGQPFPLACEQALATQQPVVLENHYMPWDHWFENRIYPSPDGLSIYFTDITTRKQAEQALRVSETRYRLAASHGQVWDWDMAAGRVTYPAPFWEQLGCEPPPAQEVVSRFQALLHPEDVPRWRAALQAHLARRLPYDLEFRARHASGEWRWFHTRGQAVWDANGRATYMAGTTFDTTDRKRAEQALREAEAYQRSLFEQLADGVLLIDHEHRVLDVNPQMLAMLGYRRDELLRLPAGELVVDAERHRVDDVVAGVMSGQPHLAEWEFLRQDGSRFFAEASARMLDDQRFIAVVRDITARRESEKALLTYQLELSDLTHQLLAQEKTTTQRVAQALHDHLGQTLAVARLNLDACISVHGANMPEAMKAQGAQLSILLDQAVRQVRQVLSDLRPPLLEDRGLTAALDNEIGAHAVAGGSADVLLEVADDASGQRWPADVEYGAFMVAREAIANARQHAGASLIRVVLGGDDASLRLDVIDDGAGIPAPLVHGRPGHLGIVGMRERAIAIGARFSVGKCPAGGTQVMLRWEEHGA